MIDKIKALRAELEAVVADDAAAVEALRIKYLSKKGAISALMNDFRNVDPSQKRELGQALNDSRPTPPSASTPYAKPPSAATTRAATST